MIGMTGRQDRPRKPTRGFRAGSMGSNLEGSSPKPGGIAVSTRPTRISCSPPDQDVGLRNRATVQRLGEVPADAKRLRLGGVVGEHPGGLVQVCLGVRLATREGAVRRHSLAEAMG